MEKGLTKNRIIAELTRSSHGNLKEYAPIAREAARGEPEFFAHLIAWNERNGAIRDSRVALPIISLSEPAFDSNKDGKLGELAENSLAHIALLDPRNMVRAVRFYKELRTDLRRKDLPSFGRAVNRTVERYLRTREENPRWFDGTVVQHRRSMKELYALCRIAPGVRADAILFKGERPAGTAFEAVARLSSMPVKEAALAINKFKLPFLIVSGALGAKAKDPDLLLAMIEQMTPQEVLVRAKLLEKFGVKDTPAVRGALEQKLQEAAEAKRGVSALKATKAAEALGDSKLAERVRGVQEKQLDKLSVDGNWLVLADKSGSMSQCIEASRHIAATLSRMTKGTVTLVFFDTMPHAIDATGKDYDVLLKQTSRVTANGGTSIGCGLRYAMEAGVPVDGVVVVSDGGENNPPYFASVYPKFAEQIGKEVPVYFYRLEGSDGNQFSGSMRHAGLDMQEFDLGHGKLDYYSLPNLVATMRTQRYGLVEQIMETPLLRLDAAFKVRRAEEMQL